MFLILLAILAVSFIYLKIIKPYSHWPNRGVKQRKQIYILGDNAAAVLRKESFVDTVKNAYSAFPDERYMGIYQFLLPTLVLRDPELIKQITVKDFDHFVDHRQLVPEDMDPLWSKNLVSLKGDRWRDMRSTLSPSFTSSKMKGIFVFISECAEQYCQHFLQKGDNDDVVSIELKDIFSKYTNDVIATSAFGIKCDSLKDPDNEFYVRGRDAMNFKKVSRRLRFLAFTVAPRLCKLLGLTLFPKELNDFFIRVVKETMQLREEKGIVRPDMLHLLMEAKKGRLKQDETNGLVDTGFATVEELDVHNARKVGKREITDLDITAQALIFFFGGFESTSTMLSFMGHELTVNLDIQKKLQREVDETLKECDGKLTYEALMKMKYMDMVVSETLRKWPTAIATDRLCVKPYTIEPTRPNEKLLRVEKGDLLWIPIVGLHWDPQYFPNPDVFDPERFNDENKGKIPPYAYIPFGAGPRNCIGSRFALLEIKTLFFILLRNFDFVPTEKTQNPLIISKTAFSLLPDNGFWIGLKARSLVK